ncbi:hypothetical protein LXL04_037675 [Taraxacum kok-saghyz]
MLRIETLSKCKNWELTSNLATEDRGRTWANQTSNPHFTSLVSSFVAAPIESHWSTTVADPYLTFTRASPMLCTWQRSISGRIGISSSCALDSGLKNSLADNVYSTPVSQTEHLMRTAQTEIQRNTTLSVSICSSEKNRKPLMSQPAGIKHLMKSVSLTGVDLGQEDSQTPLLIRVSRHQERNRPANYHSPDSESITPCYFSKSLSDFEMGDTLMVITAGRDSGVGSRSKPKLWTSPCSACERNPFSIRYPPYCSMSSPSPRSPNPFLDN